MVADAAAAAATLPDDAVNEVLLTVLGCVWAVNVQGLKHSVGQTLRLKVALNSNVACSTAKQSTAQHNVPCQVTVSSQAWAFSTPHCVKEFAAPVCNRCV
jgi:hypothetical protein